MNKLLFLSLMFAFLDSCNTQSNQEKWKSQAIYAYNEFRMWQDGAMMNSVDFEGPVICKPYQIKGGIQFDNKNEYYGWYFIHKLDTIWIYCIIDKNEKNKPIMSSSPNFDELGLNWRDWIKLERLDK